MTNEIFSSWEVKKSECHNYGLTVGIHKNQYAPSVPSKHERYTSCLTGTSRAAKSLKNRSRRQHCSDRLRKVSRRKPHAYPAPYRYRRDTLDENLASNRHFSVPLLWIARCGLRRLPSRSRQSPGNKSSCRIDHSVHDATQLIRFRPPGPNAPGKALDSRRACARKMAIHCDSSSSAASEWPIALRRNCRS
jgi:hypothetical protein